MPTAIAPSQHKHNNRAASACLGDLEKHFACHGSSDRNDLQDT